MKVDLDGAQISVVLGALDTERKSLVRAQAAKAKVQGLAEVYGHQIKLVDSAADVLRAVPLPGK